jgi:hypothetical protein
MGLRSVAFHPDFARAGKPGYRALYTVHTGTAAVPYRGGQHHRARRQLWLADARRHVCYGS